MYLDEANIEKVAAEIKSLIGNSEVVICTLYADVQNEDYNATSTASVIDDVTVDVSKYATLQIRIATKETMCGAAIASIGDKIIFNGNSITITDDKFTNQPVIATIIVKK